MSIKLGLLFVASAGLSVGLTACGTSDTTNNTEATTPDVASASPPTSSPASATSSPPTSSPASTTSSPPTPSPAPPAVAESSSPTASPRASKPVAQPIRMTINNFKYTFPASVSPGAKITVRNEDPEAHTVTSATRGAFDVNVPGAGMTKTFTAPTKPGSYKFVCIFHGNMEGTVVVK